jgi:hypothetical protein
MDAGHKRVADLEARLAEFGAKTKALKQRAVGL